MDLWIPPSARNSAPTRFTCRICDDKFVDSGAYEAHVIRCSNVHENELHEYVQWRNEWLAPPDPEWAAYNEDLQKRGIDPDKQFGRPKGSKPLRES